MAEKQFARSGAKGPDVFADDDPLAELARIVGFEPKPVAANTQRRDPSFVNIRPVEQLREPEIEAAVPRPQHPIFNLEDELLREFEMFDAPRNDNTAPEREEARVDVAPEARPGQSAAERREPELSLDDQPQPVDAPQVEAFAEAPSFVEAIEPETISGQPELSSEAAVARQEPAFTSRSYSFDPPFDLDVPAAQPAPVAAAAPAVETFEFDLANELEMAVGSSVASEPAPASAPLVEQPVLEEPVAIVEPVAPSAPAQAPVAQRFRSLATDFRMQRATYQPAAAAEPAAPIAEIPATPVIEPIARDVREESARAAAQREPHFEEPAIEWDRLAEELTSVISEPDQPQIPQGGFRSAKELSSDDLLDDVSRFPVPATPAVASSASLAPDVTAEPKSAATRFEKPMADTQSAAPNDPAFEFDFDNIELELADMNFDEPPVVAPEPKPRPQAQPVRAPEPVASQPVRANFVPPLVMQAPVERAPVAPTPATPVVAAAPVKPTPAMLTEDGELPFDPSLIADAEEHPEVVPHLDVPSLPAVEPEETIAPEPEYDLDIDAEMANLFAPMKSAEPEIAAPSSVAAVSAVALDTKDPQRFENGKAAIDEFDEFERALEEDFRRAMGEPMADGDHAQPMILGPGMSYATPEPARPRRLSRGLIVGVAAAVIGMAGLAGAYTLFFAPNGGVAGSSSSTGPRIIAADTEPTKVVPENPGGKTVPNQDKAVYDRVAGNATAQPKQDSLLSSTEEPIDVVQRTLGPESLPMDSGEDAIANMQTPVGETEDARLLGDDTPAAAKSNKPGADGSNPGVSPRKVRTMIVKADGTLVARETEQPEAAPAAQAPASTDLKPALATPAQPTQDAQKSNDIASVIDQAAEDQPATTNQNDPPLRTVRTTKVEAPTAAATATPAAPVPASRPADQPVNVVGTVTERGTVRKPAEEQAAAPEQQVAAATPGGYVMQIASLPSEAEAKKSYSSLSSKFGSLIGGRGYEIKKAEIAGKGTFYRVRVAVGSKDAAAALCVKYRAAGGTCLVSK